MTIAEIHGKLSPEKSGGLHDRMEDLLTSDVFGTMRYTGWQYGFMTWLRSAHDPENPERRGVDLFPESDEIKDIKFDFWPTLRRNRKPDLMMCITKGCGTSILLMVEAKYLSGPSDYKTPDDWGPGENSGNQIADQINDFPLGYFGLTPNKIEARVHLYVTAHFLCPTAIYADSAPLITEHDVVRLWLNWYSLRGCLLRSLRSATGGIRYLIEDLILLLERKKLVPFEGFTAQKPIGLMALDRTSFWESALFENALPPGIPEIGSFGQESPAEEYQ